MKKLLLTLLAIHCFTFAYSQVINLSPATLVFTAPAGSTSAPQAVTITASGLSPATGYIVVSPPPKYAVSSGGSIYNFVDSIAYSGGMLPPTTLNVEYASPGSGYVDHSSILVAGGGASASICACGNNPACPCAPAFVAIASGEQSITVLPNPVVNELVINSTSRITTIAISNLIGKTVYAAKFNAEKVQVDVTGLPNGIYIVRINNEEVRRFIKQ